MKTIHQRRRRGAWTSSVSICSPECAPYQPQGRMNSRQQGFAFFWSDLALSDDGADGVLMMPFCRPHRSAKLREETGPEAQELRFPNWSPYHSASPREVQWRCQQGVRVRQEVCVARGFCFWLFYGRERLVTHAPRLVVAAASPPALCCCYIHVSPCTLACGRGLTAAITSWLENQDDVRLFSIEGEELGCIS